MGKIKSRLIKRTAKTLIEKGIEFNNSFDYNKKILGNTMPSKKIRNRIAGYTTRLIKNQQQKEAEMQKSLEEKNKLAA